MDAAGDKDASKTDSSTDGAARRESVEVVSAGSAQEEPAASAGKDTAAFIMMTVALMSGTFLVALDTNILATAIPKITTEFSSLDHVSWYGAAYSLCKMVFQPSYGRMGSVFPLKTVFYIANFLLAVGSVVSALAPSSEVLILGRAIQGWGGAGIFSTIITMSGFAVSKHKMPLFISILSSMYIAASILGPIIGGVFADSRVTWRFCFWINLPIIAVSVLLTHFAIKEPERESTKAPLLEKLAKLDPVGTLVLMGSVVCLILALQWGGITMPWSDSRVWGCLLGFVLTLALFIWYQVKRKEDALIPMRIITQRTVASSCAVATLLIIGVNVPIYYLPFYFQASLGLSTTKSGLYILPLAACNPVASIISGSAVTKTGVYVPWMMTSGALAAVGYGLLSTLNMNSNLGHILGYQIVASIGFGLGIQLPFTAVRNVLDDADIAIANALVVFFQGLGTSLSLSVGQTVFLNILNQRLRAKLPAEEAQRIADLGAGDVDSDHIEGRYLPIVTKAYNIAMQNAMYLGIASAIAAFLCSCCVEWRKIERQKKEEEETGEKASGEEEASK
jgi:MFS family permease